MQLTTMKKCDLSIVDYYSKMKNMANTLADIGSPLKDEELISYVLAGLGQDYESLMTLFTTRPNEVLAIDDVYSYMMSTSSTGSSKIIFGIGSCRIFSLEFHLDRSVVGVRGSGK
ncbi:hypothetical protein PR202_ga23260 [Eleusine coracana subsp. coracana]|uniref:Retrovirus-related Pol polyprotein from transposon TNT 1-94 n=1 Tax=Eleusine coracana subsp. coracana TaxID=191504 RepID=A0AAV5D5E0_ELECO|nr:hypothetical protein PR202_ga23260 [Eleusine coracana subsp. coracana]